MDGLNGLFSPIGVLVVVAVVSLMWYTLSGWRATLSPQARSWVHLTLLCAPSLVFFWWWLEPVKRLWHGSLPLLGWYLRVDALLAVDAVQYQIWVIPLVLQAVLVMYALVLAIVEQVSVSAYLRRFQQSSRGLVNVLDSAQPVAFTHGWWRPRVFVSRAVMDSDLRDAVLAHEMVHQQRFDPLRLGLARVAYRLALLNPLATWLWRQYQLEVERICDAQAARAIGLKPYTTALLDYAVLRQASLPAVSSFSSASMLELRVQSLLMPQPRSRLVLLVSSLILVALIGLIGWQRQASTVFQNPEGLETPQATRLGIQLLALQDNHRLQVVTVYPQSLSDRAGFRVGDEVVSVCGQSPADFISSQWKKCEFVVNRSGQTLRLTLDRGQP